MKNLIKKLARNFGVEFRSFTVSTSEVARLQYLLRYHKIDCIFDVGANVGRYARFLRDIGYSGKVVSFEPLSSAYSQLKALSKKDPLWEIAPRTAIGDVDGEIELKIAANSESSSVLNMLDSHLKVAPNSAYIGLEKVKVSRIDTIAHNYINSDVSIFLKIDVQGFEMQVLEGASQILPQVKGIQLELSLVPLYESEPLFVEVMEKMKQLGYELYAFFPVLTDMKTGRLMQVDGIFFKD